MTNQSSIIHQNKFKHPPKESNIPIGLSNPFVDQVNNKLGISLKNSTRILGSEMTDVSQDHKRRCLEKLGVRRGKMMQQNVEDVNCALKVEVIDDTALIEATAGVNRFKNLHRKETDLGYGKNLRNCGGLSKKKEENDVKKKKKERNKGFEKQGNRCSMKCLNEKNQKKSNVQVVEDKNTSVKKIPEGKDHKGYRKMAAKVKYVYKRKDTKNLVEEDQKDENQNVVEEIVGESVQENDVSLNVSVGDEKESTDVSLNVSVGDEKESNVTSVDTESVNENDDGSKSNPQTDVITHTETEEQNVSENTSVGSKKIAYTRAEMEALRFVDEVGQKAKWDEVYGGFALDVVREYNGLVVDVSDRPTRYNKRVVNCGYTRYANPILGMPPVIPLCSPSSDSSHRKLFDRSGFGVSFN